MIVNITRSVVAFPHAASVSSYKYGDVGVPGYNMGLSACIVEDHSREGGDILHVIYCPEPRMVRPEKVDVVRLGCQVHRSCLEYIG